jgi:hypothetical protein
VSCLIMCGQCYVAVDVLVCHVLSVCWRVAWFSWASSSDWSTYMTHTQHTKKTSDKEHIHLAYA